MTKVKVLIEGYAKETGSGWLASSTVTLIEDIGIVQKQTEEELLECIPTLGHNCEAQKEAQKARPCEARGYKPKITPQETK